MHTVTGHSLCHECPTLQVALLIFPWYLSYIAMLCREPLCLRVGVRVRGWHCEVVMSVDVRVGTVSVEVEPRALGEGVGREVEEMERGIVVDSALPGHLARLQ